MKWLFLCFSFAFVLPAAPLFAQENYQLQHIQGLWKRPHTPDRYLLITEALGLYECRQAIGDRTILTVVCFARIDGDSFANLSFNATRDRFCLDTTVACAGGFQVNSSNPNILEAYGAWMKRGRDGNYRKILPPVDTIFIPPID